MTDSGAPPPEPRSPARPSTQAGTGSPTGPPRRLRRLLVAVGSALLAALAAVVVADLYGAVRDRLSDDDPAPIPTADPGEIVVIQEEGDPLTALVQVADPCPGFVVPTSLELPDPPGVRLDRDWVYLNGGADASGTSYQVTVQGASETAVVLQSLEVVDVTPLEADDDLTYSGALCSALTIPVRHVGIDLDTPEVAVATSLGQPVDFPLQVSSTEAEVFTVSARTESCFCTWSLDLRWVSGGEAGTTRLEPPAGRFVTAPVPERAEPEPTLPPEIVWRPPPIRPTIPPELLDPGRLL